MAVRGLKPEPGKPVCRAGACRVCLKSFKPEDFFRTCCECTQKVCEDCASYSKLDENQDESTWRCSICRRKLQSRAAPPVMTQESTDSLLDVPVLEALQRRHSDVKIGSGSSLTVSGGGGSGLAPPRSPELRRHSDVSPASLKELEKVAGERREELRWERELEWRQHRVGGAPPPQPGGQPGHSPQVERRPFPSPAKQVGPDSGMPEDESEAEAWRRQRARGRRQSRVTRQRSYDEELKAATAAAAAGAGGEPSLGRRASFRVVPQPQPPPQDKADDGTQAALYIEPKTASTLEGTSNNVGHQYMKRLRKEGMGRRSKSMIGCPLLAMQFRTLHYTTLKQQTAVAIYRCGAAAWSSYPQRTVFQTCPLVADSSPSPLSPDATAQAPAGLSLGVEEDRRTRRRGSQLPDLGMRALPQTPPSSGTPTPRGETTDAVRRQTSVTDGEAIKIVIHDVDCDFSPRPGAKRRVVLRRDPADKAHRTRGFGMRVVGGKTGADGRLFAYIVWTVPGGPAEKGGLQQGDKVLEWDGVSLVDRSFEEVCAIMDRSGESAELLVEHATDFRMCDLLDEPIARKPASESLGSQLEGDQDKTPTSPTRRKLPKTPV
ncbi:uncharacterized protein LOC126474601 [Schistocerca serialis cubense]|uniref:uncharacterized protein LOC126474601 n=1 Tax=Schistocerca serialis cubense TaxID=2023355 RepID=UPI00214F4AA7|nr:uncharacterized protein LOC126474601 [Schistocerca serialis cubense]